MSPIPSSSNPLSPSPYLIPDYVYVHINYLVNSIDLFSTQELIWAFHIMNLTTIILAKCHSPSLCSYHLIYLVILKCPFLLIFFCLHCNQTILKYTSYSAVFNKRWKREAKKVVSLEFLFTYLKDESVL